MIYPFDKLLLSWRQGAGHRRHIVGELSLAEGTSPTFSYLDQGIEQAKEYGFTDYPGLPYGESINQEIALDLFYRRLINAERNDAHRLLSFLCVDMSRLDDKLYLLGITTGQSAVDYFEFLPILKPTVEAYDFVTEVAGLGYCGFNLSAIKEGEILKYALEENNPKDPKAVVILDSRGDVVGYIKQGVNQIFHTTAQVTPYVHRVIKSEQTPALFLRLHIESK